MKKYYIFLSIISVFLLAFIGLAIFYYHDYYEITKEIYKLEVNHTFTSLIPFFNDKRGKIALGSGANRRRYHKKMKKK